MLALTLREGTETTAHCIAEAGPELISNTAVTHKGDLFIFGLIVRTKTGGQSGLWPVWIEISGGLAKPAILAHFSTQTRRKAVISLTEGRLLMSSITVRYFASLRERLGRSQEEVPAAGTSSAAEVWRRVCPDPMPLNTLIAINQEYAGPDSPVKAGDEVAFFPPVTGG